MILISIDVQILYHRRRTGTWHEYPISTATNGPGNKEGSFCTPTGRHRIAQKIGDGFPLMTSFRGRIPAGIYNPEFDGPASNDKNRDWILTRILWLTGCELGKNLRGAVDTHDRYIYIHGTHEEKKIGTPASHGCIRMRNADMLELFEHTFEGERVYIR